MSVLVSERAGAIVRQFPRDRRGPAPPLRLIGPDAKNLEGFRAAGVDGYSAGRDRLHDSRMRFRAIQP